MKQQTNQKQLITKLLMVVLFLTFVNCHKENSIEETITEHINKPNLKAYIVQTDSIFKIHPKLKRMVTQRFNTESDNFYKNITSSTYGFSIDTTRVQLLVAESYETYTFVVTRDGYNENILENYVLTLFDNGTYNQMLVSYPFTISENVVSYDILNAYGQYINDTDLLTSNRGPMCGWSGDEIIAWDENAGDCVDFPCGGNTGNGNHMPGQACDATGSDRARTECTGAWVPVSCISSNIDNDGGNGGDLPGGGPVLDQDGNPIEHIPIITLEPDYSQPILECLFGGPQMGEGPTEGQEVSAALDNLSSETLILIQSYLLLQNQCSEEAKAFTKAVALAGPDAEVDYANKIIKDPSFIGTKADCVLNALISSNNNLFRTTSQAFTNQNSKFKIKFTTYNNSSDPADARTALPDINGIIEIRFNLANMNTTSMSIATTILHETIHAELHRIYLSNNQGPNPLPQNQYDWYVSLWQYYNNGNQNYVASTAEHYYMATYLINNIASGLREFDENTHSLNNYKRFAWTGLETYGTTAQLITNSELSNLANLSAVVNSDNHENPCD